jgi:hypothetical protein
LITKNAIKPSKLIQLAKCIDNGTKELDKAQLDIHEKNIAQLNEIEKTSLERTNSIIEKLNSLKATLPTKIDELRKIEQEKLDKLKAELDKKKVDSLVESLNKSNIEDKNKLLTIKTDLDKKLSALKLSKKIAASKSESGPEFQLVMLDDSVLNSLSGLFIQNLSPSILVKIKYIHIISY